MFLPIEFLMFLAVLVLWAVAGPYVYWQQKYMADVRPLNAQIANLQGHLEHEKAENAETQSKLKSHLLNLEDHLHQFTRDEFLMLLSGGTFDKRQASPDMLRDLILARMGELQETKDRCGKLVTQLDLCTQVAAKRMRSLYNLSQRHWRRIDDPRQPKTSEWMILLYSGVINTRVQAVEWCGWDSIEKANLLAWSTVVPITDKLLSEGPRKYRGKHSS